MKETEQVIIIELSGGNYYYNLDIDRLVEYDQYSYIPAKFIKHTFEDACDCGANSVLKYLSFSISFDTSFSSITPIPYNSPLESVIITS